ncbi:naked cuticle-like protein 3 isoform X2 [Triplophysa rosa]|uniref:naked cuticle-like protein 3 isoform X2 n=1 Tax=Triplophysa rosa TaxID=992332 RepID=UPI002545DDE4|nr:naked cuticle-like protein 3 isoform X2 [Triplophysa rosa]
MGKLQSKHACTRRENPEGGAFKEAVDCVGEVDRNEDKQDLCGKDLKEDHLSHHYCALEDRDIKILRDEQDQMKDNIRCAEGQPSHIRGQNSCNMGVPERKHYSVDENTERRNHYLDLAGIENYSSQFEAEPSSEDVPYRGHQHRSHIENHSFVEFTGRSVSFLRSLRSRSKSIGGSGGTAKPSKLHGYHPVTWCQPSQQHSSSKRIRTRARDITAPSRANQGLHRELQPGQAVPPGGFKYVPQRHEHYHHHEHHHHHYHHYHPT